MFGWIATTFGAITDWALTALGSRDIEPPLTGALRSFLLADARIAALVSADQIRPLRLPQKPTLPTIVLLRLDDIRGVHLRGVNAQAKARLQVECWDRTTDGATALGAYVARRLSGFSGRWTTTSSPAQSISVTVLPEDEGDRFDEDIQGGLCRHSADYFLYHRLT